MVLARLRATGLDVSRELVPSEACRSDEEILTCQEKWRAKLEAEGWKK